MIRRINDWREWRFGRDYNWQEFHALTLHVERDNVCQTVDLTLAVLGLGVEFAWYAPGRLFPANDVREWVRNRLRQYRGGGG